MRIDLDPISERVAGFEKPGKCGSIPSVGIESGELVWKTKPSSQTNCFSQRQGEKAEFGLALKAHTVPPTEIV